MKFTEFANKQFIIFDGAMGTSIQAMNLPESLWGNYSGNNEILNITSPESIESIYSGYYKAGSNIVLTNTFGANAIVLAEYGLQDKVAEINTAAVSIAQKAASAFTNKFIGLSVGPGSKLPTLSQISYDELYAAYSEQIQSAATAGIDVIMIETCQDLLQVKAAIAAAMDVNNRLSMEIPIMVSLTVEDNGAMLVGTDMKCAAHVLSGYPLFSLGLNCGFGPDKMAAPLSELAENYGGRLYISANAGIPVHQDGELVYPMLPEEFAEITHGLIHKYKLSAAGGCCGTNSKHIAALAQKMNNQAALAREAKKPGSGQICSAYTSSPLRQEPAPTLIGERANATGSKAFRELLKENDFNAMANTAKAQEEASHIIDISVALSGRDEASDMRAIVPLLNRELTLPLMIDSTSEAVIHSALKNITGKPIINSINFEDGGVKLHKILKLIKYFPAAVVALTIDENGMAQTKEDKLNIAERLYDVWANEYHYPPEDLIIDFLTFSVASGDEGSRFAAVNTLDAIREFKNRHPEVNTTLGVSNVSFGLSAHSRTVLNAVFLNKAVEAGLDTAIVHAEKVLPVSSIGEKELTLCNDLLDGREGALDAFIKHFADVQELPEAEKTSLSPEEELAEKIVKGNSSKLNELLTVLLEKYSAADILNDILLAAMQRVGTLFNEGKMLLPFVLKSAEVMKECSKYLEPYLKENAGTEKGTVVLATVKGDVHDIGKNLVDIILSGNGYKVINMGTKVSGDDIAKAIFEHDADAVGMSGLLVKSVEIMKENIELFRDLNVDSKILLGGAALSEDYVQKECEPLMPGKVFYCKDAFAGVAAMNNELSPAGSAKEAKNIFDGKDWNIEPFEGAITADFYGSSPVHNASICDILPNLRKISLLEGRWGLRKNDNPDAYAAAEEELDKILGQIAPALQPSFIYGFYPVIIKKNELWISTKPAPESDDDWQYFASFPTGHYMQCFTDLYMTSSSNATLPLQAVTLGKEATQYLSKLYNDDKYEQYYRYHGLLVELTEALADYVQKTATSKLHFLCPQGDLSVERTWRYSFGYPLCPDLEGNKAICDLLNADKIGITLSESFQMEPVHSTCAMLSWHPGSKY